MGIKQGYWKKWGGGVEEFEIQGKVTQKTNLQTIHVVINNNIEKNFTVNNGNFTLNFKIEDFGKEEWNYIELTTDDPIFHPSDKCKFFIHNIPSQAAIFIPEELVKQGREANSKNTFDYQKFQVKGYTFISKYFGKESIKEESDVLKLDKNGIPMAKYTTGYEYNPVTIAQNALGTYNEYLDSGSDKQKQYFLTQAEWLVQQQNEDGAYPYPFSYQLYDTAVLPQGFISSMAQGQVLSVMARAYYITADDKYLECGNKALNFMVKTADNDIFSGGARTLEDITVLSKDMYEFSDYRVFEEYVFDPSVYVLNGDLFALIGLYDWASAAPKEFGRATAENAFQEGVKGIEVILPYYDFYGWSAYDLYYLTEGNSNPTFGSEYAHACHIYLLESLADVSGSTCFRKYAERFKMYKDDEFWKQTKDMYREGVY